MNRIAVCEVYSVLAHDFGLYGIAARLDEMGFRPGMSLATGPTRGLDPEQHEAYLSLVDRAMKTLPWDRRLAR